MIVINNIWSGLNILSGGVNIGIVIGNILLVVNDFGGRIVLIYGGGYGINVINIVNVIGNVLIKVVIMNVVIGF